MAKHLFKEVCTTHQHPLNLSPSEDDPEDPFSLSVGGVVLPAGLSGPWASQPSLAGGGGSGVAAMQPGLRRHHRRVSSGDKVKITLSPELQSQINTRRGQGSMHWHGTGVNVNKLGVCGLG